MNFNETEFNSVTDKLERYASQVSALQARLDAQETIDRLKEQLHMSENQLIQCQAELAARDKELEEKRIIIEEQKTTIIGLNNDNTILKKECERMKDIAKSAAVENAFLTNCILLSVSNIKHFFKLVKHLQLKTVLHAFLIKTVSPEMGPKGLEVINEAADFEEEFDGKLADQIIIDNSGTISHD